MTKFLVSTDTAGIYGNPKDWKNVWGSVLQNKNFSGFELIAWKRTLPLLRQSDLKIVGVHGPTGGAQEGRGVISKLMLWGINQLYIDIQTLIDQSIDAQYLLLHKSCFQNGAMEIVLKNKDRIKELYIENVIHHNALSQAIDLANDLNSKGIKTGLTIDFVHFLREPSEDSPNMNRWDLLLKMIEDLSTQKFKINCHFPIGEYANDSLPVLDFSKEMWNELSNAMKKVSFDYIILENQAARKYSLYLPYKKQLEIRERSEKIFNLMCFYKII